MTKIHITNAKTGASVLRDMTPEEEAYVTARKLKIPADKLKRVKEIRLLKLEETDYLGASDLTMSAEMTTWRQSLRDIPQNYTTEEQYDLLLAREDDGRLIHSIWVKPS
tara:strand:+ start:999 stop:1325 length:327 start_codon:yes stop_codon:yes gene_type:complete